MVVYLLYHLFRNFNEGYETEIVEKATARETITLDAYIFRNETALTSSYGTDLNYLCEDGEKVSKDLHFADVYSSDNGQLTDRIIEIDKKISLLESCNRQKDETLSDVQVIDSGINSLYYSLLQKSVSGDLEYAVREKNDLIELLNRRQIVVRVVDDFDDQITALKEERKRLSAGLSDVVANLYAPVSGYFYTSVDGYESIFTVDKIDTLDPVSFDAIVSAPPASTDNIVAKFVTDYRWYLVCEIRKDQNRYFSAGLSYSVVFPYSSLTMELPLYKVVSSAEEDRVLLIFSSDLTPSDLTFYRMQEIVIIQREYKGYRVPVSSARLNNGQLGVYVLNGNIIRFKKIDPLLEQNGYYIVSPQPSWMADGSYKSWLGLYDRVITKGTGLYDGKIAES